MQAVRFVAWSDYLCPWCWNASRALWRLIDEFDGQVQVEWKSYLLRPVEKKGRDPEKFRRYTEGWKVPAAEPGAGAFRVWSSEDAPPSHSVPAHRVAKAAAMISNDAFRRMHERLMTAYFAENRDVSSEAVLRTLWEDVGLDRAAFERARDSEIETRIRLDHEEAREWGANGVPAIRRIDNDAVLVGAHPEALYRRWIERSLARGEGVVAIESTG